MKHIVVRLLGIFVILVSWGGEATAQQPKKVLTIGYLSGRDAASVVSPN